jgi:uncharacterized NAD(P)/FAD-binding protein YdhS
MTAGISQAIRLAIIGGGYTGAALAVHALRAASRPLDVQIIEPEAELGQGIAYGATDPAHRINVPSDKMSLFGDDPSHLTRWLEDNHWLPDEASTDAQGHHYVARAAFAAYVKDVLKQTLQGSEADARWTRHRARAIALHRDGMGWIVELSTGRRLSVDKVALCVGHAAPMPPCPVSAEASNHAGFIANPWASGAMSGVRPHQNVLIVGTGLTMADVVATLSAGGHQAPVTAVSRRGLTPRPHGRFLDDIDILGGEAAPQTALGVLRLARRRTREFENSVGWQPIMDALRFKLRQIWPALSPQEQRRVARRLLPFWEVHRFRIAPQLHDLVEDWRRQGRLVVEKAALASLEAADGKLIATLQRRDGAQARRAFDAVALCTGPGKALEKDPLAAQLVREGLARPDATATGLTVDDHSHLIDRQGLAQANLFAFGPLTRGSFGEMTGAPDITRQIERVAPMVGA